MKPDISFKVISSKQIKKAYKKGKYLSLGCLYMLTLEKEDMQPKEAEKVFQAKHVMVLGPLHLPVSTISYVRTKKWMLAALMV